MTDLKTDDSFFMLLGAPGIATSNKCIATSSKGHLRNCHDGIASQKASSPSLALPSE